MAVESPPIQLVRSNPGYLRAKRALDVVFTLLIFLPLCVVMAIVALIICLDSKGPVFFKQRRIGLNGKEFTMLKFRSMYMDSDETIHRWAVERYMKGEMLNIEQEKGNMYKLSADADLRITRIGRFIRKTSIDELPQFFNVLRGEMSLVGPRPPVPYEVERYLSHDWLRLSGRPGLTGTWQVYARSQVSFQEMVEMDIAYLRKQSLWLDLKLILLTPAVMIFGKGGS